jgi:hypothetical protein
VELEDFLDMEEVVNSLGFSGKETNKGTTLMPPLRAFSVSSTS